MSYKEVHTRLEYINYYSSLIMRYILLFLFMYFVSCSEKDSKASGDELKSIPIEIEDFTLNIADFIQEVKYVYLQSDQAYLSFVKDILVTDDYYIITSFNRAAIYFFNKDGSLHHKIIGTGDGPLEFNSVADISLSTQPHLLYVADKNNFKILVFDYLENKFVDEHTFSYPVYSLFNYEEYIYILTNTYETGIVKSIDPSSWEVINEYVREPTIANRVLTPEPFYKPADDLYLGINLSDTIYRVKNGKLNTHFVIGNEILPSISESGIDYGEFLNEFLSQSYSENTLKLNLTMLSQAKIGNIFTIPIFSFAEDPRTIFFDQNMSKSIKIPTRSIENFNLFFKFYFQIMAYEDDDFYTSFVLNDDFYSEAAKYLDENSNSISKELSEFMELYPQEKEFENPIIVKIKFKSSFQDLIKDI